MPEPDNARAKIDHRRQFQESRLEIWGCVSPVVRYGQTIWIADAHRGDGKRSVGPADEKLIAFMELEAALGSAKRTFRVRIAEHYGN